MTGSTLAVNRAVPAVPDAEHVRGSRTVGKLHDARIGRDALVRPHFHLQLGNGGVKPDEGLLPGLCLQHMYWAMRVCDEAKASRPTAMSVSSIMRVSVATSAKPRFFRLSRRLGTGVWWMSFILERVECY